MRMLSLLLASALCGSAANAVSAYTLPFSFTASEETFAECATIDVGNDAGAGYAGDVNGGWAYYGFTKCAFKYTYHMSNRADDWLILPAVDFGDCTSVKVSFQIETYSDKENFEVRLGHDATAAGMTVDVMKRTDFSQTSFGELSAVVNLPADGNTEWRLGFHVTSPAFRGWIYVKDIKIENAEAAVNAPVPAAPAIKSSTIENQDYKAVVTMPSVDTQGNAITENMTLKVLVDGADVSVITDCAPGADINVAQTLDEGEHTVSYVAVLGTKSSEAAGESVTAKAHRLIPGMPVIKEWGMDCLTFSAVVTMPSQCTDGTAISSLMSLQILVDGVVVETKTLQPAGADVKVSRTLTEGEHTMGFAVKLGDETGESVSVSCIAKEMVLTLPVEFAATEQNFALCNVIDANGDGPETSYGENGIWRYNSEKSAFEYTYHSLNQADDWVILPAFERGDVTKVKVSLDVMTGSYPEGFEVLLGNSRTVAGMTIPVMKKENFTNKDEFTTLTAEIELPEGSASGMCLGIHAISQADKFKLFVKNIKIEDANAPVVIPAAPEIKESTINNRAYTAVVTMPAVDTEGNAICDAMSLEVTVDGVLVDTYADCAPAADVDVNLSLASGAHTVSYCAVLGEVRSETVNEDVTATELTAGDLPFTFQASQDNFDQCVVEDLDGSVENYGNVQGAWSLSADGKFKYTYHPDSQADDWLILPLVDFATSVKVLVSVDVMTKYDTEAFEIFLGNARTHEAMTIPVMKQTGFVSNNKWTMLSQEVELPTHLSRSADNSYALGIHAISPANHYNMYFNNIKIESLATTGVEEILTDGNTDAPCEYYNLQGIKVENPGAGIYIVRQGSVTRKVKIN